MRAELAAGLLLLAASASAHDAGKTVTFGAETAAVFRVGAGDGTRRVVYDSGESDPISGDWDTVLIQGESPDPAVSFEMSRTAPSPAAVWRTLETHRAADGRFWAKASVAKASGPLELRAVETGAAAHEVRVLGVEVFDAAEADPASPAALPAPAPAPAPVPGAARPVVVSRADWGAVAPTEPWTPDPLRWRVTLHHSDGRHTTTLEETEAEARFIQDFHIHGRGWIDIAYHFLVDASGHVLEGRPEGALGAHTLANNEGNVGIVLLGTYHPPVNDKPTKAQLDAVAAIGRYLVARYGIDPKELKGHRDYKQTDCPGDRAYAKLDALRLAFGGGPTPSAPFAVRTSAPALPAFALDAPSFDGQRAP